MSFGSPDHIKAIALWQSRKHYMNPLTSSILHSIFVDQHNKNWVFSPASYLEAMSNLAVCLKGENLAELFAALPNLVKPQAIGLETYNCLLYSVEYCEALNEVVLDILHLRHGDIRPFAGPEVVGIVNNLVYEKTRGKISNLISRDDITEFTKFIILNCVYFKKAWLVPFREAWSVEDFKGANGVSRVKYLRHWSERHRYYEGAGYDIVELPYKESDVCCYLIVPTTGSAFEVFNSLSEVFGHIANVKDNLLVNLTVPPFKTESRFDLADVTQMAGVKKAFEWNKEWDLVDWSKLKPEAMMKVEKIIQKAYIDFSKDGTEAAAATVVMIAVSGCYMSGWTLPPPTKNIVADKPFVYVLANKQEPDKPLFVGVVNDIPDAPTDQPSGNSFVWPTGTTGFSDIGLSGVLNSFSGINNL